MESLTNCDEEEQPSSGMTNSLSKQEAFRGQMPKCAGGFVLVHAGAGYHSESKAKEYKHVCKRACQRAVDQLRAGALAVEAVTAALVELEDSPFTNAGMGSNLNLSGKLNVMQASWTGSLFILAQLEPLALFSGARAHDWAVSHGIPSCASEKMATKFSLSAYKRNKRKMELAEKMDAGQNQTKKRRQSSENENGSGCQDTVGAVVVDSEGNVAAAVSSGGLAMKHPGRVGQAAHYGCGCWAENACNRNSYSTAVSTSGCGEHLVRTMLARECSAAMQSEDAHQALLEAMQNKFISSPFLASEDRVLGGVIVLRCCRCVEAQASPDIQGAMVEFLWSHTTESMCVGYMSAQDSKAKTHISRLPPGTVPGQSLAIEGGVSSDGRCGLNQFSSSSLYELLGFLSNTPVFRKKRGALAISALIGLPFAIAGLQYALYASLPSKLSSGSSLMQRYVQ